MTRFEIVIGHYPFEDELEQSRESFDLVIKGQRPKLPSDLDARLIDFIQKCGNPNPNQWPTFIEIYDIFGLIPNS